MKHNYTTKTFPATKMLPRHVKAIRISTRRDTKVSRITNVYRALLKGQHTRRARRFLNKTWGRDE